MVTSSVVSRIISLAIIFSPALNAAKARGEPPASLDIVPSGISFRFGRSGNTVCKRRLTSEARGASCSSRTELIVALHGRWESVMPLSPDPNPVLVVPPGSGRAGLADVAPAKAAESPRRMPGTAAPSGDQAKPGGGDHHDDRPGTNAAART